MKGFLLIPLLGLAWLLSPRATAAASHTTTFSAGRWTLTLTFKQASYGEISSGSFRSPHRTFQVHGDWIPAGDEGSYLLRFYGHPVGMSRVTGLVGVAVLANTCRPNCASSRSYQLVDVRPYPSLPDKLPGVNKSSLIVRLRT